MQFRVPGSEFLVVLTLNTEHSEQVSHKQVEKRERLNMQLQIQAIPSRAKFIDPEWFIWGGSMVRTDDGVCHLLYSRWPRRNRMSGWVTHCEVAHAVADDPLGPFRHVDPALPLRGGEYWDGLCTHNPTVHRFGDKYYLYYTGNTGDGRAIPDGLNWTHRNKQRIGVAVADHPDGPWKRRDAPIIDVGEGGAPDSLCVANPSITEMHDGRYLLIYKAVGQLHKLPFGGPVVHMAAISESPTGPFHKQPGLIFTKAGEEFPAEDPYIWRQGDSYRAIVKDFRGTFTGAGRSLALFGSTDGLSWAPAEDPLVIGLDVEWSDGGKQALHRLERPQLWLVGGRPAVLYCAASEDASESHSCNLHIPLRQKDGQE